ncbi:glycosyltransferase family 1 protein [Phaffia rhodozyma]|uniref:Sterol 3-beta-glucosyltransferase n=1 Tax=Phaffia rhodozyma TaxID=264483 RepID=A0A0F7SSY8_PHARH|nr:glycosyltransferase family 1 protein [Phaffia rhodozyma]
MSQSESDAGRLHRPNDLEGMHRDFGSVRAGTQSLVQAMSAVPWDDADDSDSSGSDDEGETVSVEERRTGSATYAPQSDPAFGSGQAVHEKTNPMRPTHSSRMSSSIHTIHRPVAYSRAISESRTPMLERNKPSFSGHTDASGFKKDHTLPSFHHTDPYLSHTVNPGQHSNQNLDKVLFSHRENGVEKFQADNPTADEQDYEHQTSDKSILHGTREGENVEKEEADGDRAEEELVKGDSIQDESHEQEARSLMSRRHPDKNANTDEHSSIGRRKRKQKLAEKLRDVFNLPDVEPVLGELPCWLLRSILLQGYMYLTTGHLCFYAALPNNAEVSAPNPDLFTSSRAPSTSYASNVIFLVNHIQHKVIKSGPLIKKSRKSLRANKYWFVLKNGVLSWYTSSADPYFPQGNVDLQYAVECEPFGEKALKLSTNRKTLQFSSETVAGRDEWVKALQKVIFRTQHEGENVKIAIPLQAIVDVDKSSNMDFAETIEVKVAEGDVTLAVDSYFFAYFSDLEGSLRKIREVVSSYHSPDARVDLRGTIDSNREHVFDSISEAAQKKRSISQNYPDPTEKSPSTLSSIKSALLHPFGSDKSKNNDAEPLTSGISPRPSSTGSDLLLSTSPLSSVISSRSSSSVGVGITRVGSKDEHVLSEPFTGTPGMIDRSVTPTPADSHRYPPIPVQSDLKQTPTSSSVSSSWSASNLLNRSSTKSSSTTVSSTKTKTSSNPIVSLFGAVKTSRFKPFSTSARQEDLTTGHEAQGLYETVSPKVEIEGDMTGRASEDSSNEDTADYSLMEKSETADQQAEDVSKAFHEYFALDKNEVLIEHLPGFLFRVVPVSGQVYISSYHFCFRSTQMLSKTRMIIPLQDIISIQPQKAFRFSHQGLAIIIKGHEELFLEFSSTKKRDLCKRLLDKQIEEVKTGRVPKPAHEGPSAAMKREAKVLSDLDAKDMNSPTDSNSASTSLETTDNLPPVMFTSASSTFLNFKPKKSLHITCLTIGSRGDVQPYIALCKGLKAEGHRVRIASHGEYKDWIEGHGIEFGYVGGDPAELMRICVENGMFSVSFIKEGLENFRDWIDDLLQTSWKACQNTDLLIESPSAMGGIHIAEGLGIPYYRAFTMPWTRTRAYPHAFAVPDHHRGGSYNFMTYTMFDQVFWRAISGQVNRWRKKTIGISSTTLEKLEPHKAPFLYNFSPTVVPPPLDWYEWIRVTGYWFLDDPEDSSEKKWSPPDGLLEFIDKAHEDGKRVVYIGFGSIVVSDPDAMTKCVIEAVLDSDVRCILSKGWSDRLSAKEDDTQKSEKQKEKEKKEKEEKAKKEAASYPPEIFSLSSVPHDWLFPRIDAACHHGGAGTTGASLRAGIPTIIKPFFGDQYFWADRVEVLGVGSSVRKLNKEHFTAALKTATQSEKQIEKARELGKEIRAESGVANAIQAIYRDLEYARSLIKGPTRQTPPDASSSSSPESSPSNSPRSGPHELPSVSLDDTPDDSDNEVVFRPASSTTSAGNSAKTSSKMTSGTGFAPADAHVSGSSTGEENSDDSWDMVHNDGSHSRSNTTRLAMQSEGNESGRTTLNSLGLGAVVNMFNK